MLLDVIKRMALALPLLSAALVCPCATGQSLPTVTLAWSPTGDPTVIGYKVYEGVISQDYTNVIDVGSATSVTVSNLIPGTTYYFAVTAYTDSGLESPFSGEISYTPGLPVQPQLALAMNGANQAMLTGTAPAGYKYDLLVSSDLQTWSAIANITSDGTGILQYTDTSAPAGTRFYRLLQTSP